MAGFLYRPVVLDAGSRKIIGGAMTTMTFSAYLGDEPRVADSPNAGAADG